MSPADARLAVERLEPGLPGVQQFWRAGSSEPAGNQTSMDGSQASLPINFASLSGGDRLP